MKIYTEYNNCDRYLFDFDLCSTSKGWAQIDTSCDASYYGHWANAQRLQIVAYVEGDITIKTADNTTEFAEEIESLAKWCKDSGSRFALDPAMSEPVISSFREIGLGHFLP